MADCRRVADIHHEIAEPWVDGSVWQELWAVSGFELREGRPDADSLIGSSAFRERDGLESEGTRVWTAEVGPTTHTTYKRMKGLEPSTFCMARTWRKATGDDWSRQLAQLCGF